MVVPEAENMSHAEVESPLQQYDQQQPKNQPLSSLGRQSSIYSLTLDEFQHTLCESGKNFGSMNMDEFLTSIWTAEENQVINSSNFNNNDDNNNNNTNLSLSEVSTDKRIVRQPSLARQGSLTLPAPLCRKTVDEVWSEIHKGQQVQQQQRNNNDSVQNPDSAPRQPTFGEMTLEDFLVKAGVVREAAQMQQQQQQQPPPQPQQQQYGMYHSNNPAVAPGFVNRSVMGIDSAAGVSAGGGGGGGVVPSYQTMPQGSTAVGESSGYVANGKLNGAYQPPPPPAICYGGRVVNGGGGYPPAQPLGLPAPVSPVSSDGICTSQVDNSASQFGLDMGALRGRKRIIDGPVEKVVERRQRRMIKNRESAARSRARKQAYTVELEAELNQLREENAQLKQALAELERKRKQQHFEEMKMKVQTKGYKAKEKLRVFRRNLSCPL
ncbi:hypothetical protein FEM48_Zijuj12G0060300 [Ziziphus jujuba var. spinosa]|uniref:BZIP domain-containing protein n=1 Tax=Ziziphus jujuba var. spinosa TaxID=714518 RepID=A0A978UBL0_ZIZJJ|nr:hypothetical protein FEM48_Zijuj12G0060300 [Ziziphus jujuba var. spinosa]